MPIFSYRCKKCGQISDLLMGNQSDTLKCSNCGSCELERVYSSPNILKKGAGGGKSTCCGRTERCDEPPCSSDDTCWRG